MINKRETTFTLTPEVKSHIQRKLKQTMLIDSIQEWGLLREDC